MIKLEGGVSVDSSDSNNEKDAERDTPGSDEAGGGDEKDKVWKFCKIDVIGLKHVCVDIRKTIEEITDVADVICQRKVMFALIKQ